MATGGEGVKHTLKIVHWNAGVSWWESKRTEIQALIFLTEPDLLFVSEANLRLSTPPRIEGHSGILYSNTKQPYPYGILQDPAPSKGRGKIGHHE